MPTDSIARMATKKSQTKPAPPPEAIALDQAIKRQRLKKAAIAEHLDVHPSYVSQMVSGLRPVPADMAVPLAKLLDADPKLISKAFREVQSSGGNVVPFRTPGEADDRPYELVIARLENDVHALNLALGALASVMVVHRPAEAADAAATLRRLVPAKFLGKGFVHELIALLEKQPKH